MFIATFDEFAQAVETLYNADPTKTRFVVKFRNTAGQIEIKVTDDKTCLKYRTDQQQDLKKFEKLSKNLFRLMADIPPEFEEVEETPIEVTSPKTVTSGKKGKRTK